VTPARWVRSTLYLLENTSAGWLGSRDASNRDPTCPTKICLPNGTAREAGTREFYERIGFNERQIEIVASAIPKREYYVASPEGRRLFDMALGPVALSFAGASGKADLKRIRQLHETVGESWPMEWLKERGVGNADILLTQI